MPTTVKADDSTHTDPKVLWGTENYEGAGGEIAWHSSGGLGGAPYRSFRCPKGCKRAELGANTRNAGYPTFYRFYNNEVRSTHIMFRLHPDYPLDRTEFQVLAQWKGAGTVPGQDSPPLALRARAGLLEIVNTDYRSSNPVPAVQLWSAPMRVATWTCFHMQHMTAKNGGWIEVECSGGAEGKSGRISGLCTLPPPVLIPTECLVLMGGYYRPETLPPGGVDRQDVHIQVP